MSRDVARYGTAYPDGASVESTQAADDAAAAANTAAARADAAADQVEAIADALADGPLAADQRLREWTEAESYEVLSVTRDADGVATSASVKWPDGSGGTFTTTHKSETWTTISAYMISHESSGKTVIQEAVTWDNDGNMSVKPELEVI